jgi:hypothetical protein
MSYIASTIVHSPLLIIPKIRHIAQFHRRFVVLKLKLEREKDMEYIEEVQGF